MSTDFSISVTHFTLPAMVPPTRVEHKTTGKQTEKQINKKLGLSILQCKENEKGVHAAAMHHSSPQPANQCQETASHQHQLAGKTQLAGCWILLGLLQRLGGHHPVSDANSPDRRYLNSWWRKAAGQPASIAEASTNDKKTASTLALLLLTSYMYWFRRRKAGHCDETPTTAKVLFTIKVLAVQT